MAAAPRGLQQRQEQQLQQPSTSQPGEGGVQPCSSSADDGLDPAAGSSSAPPPVDLPYVDPSKPVVFEVGKLGRRYWDWINHPESGKPRFFGNPIVESCTKVKWWVVPLLWLPFFTTVLCYSQLTHDIGAGASLACLLLGLLTWQGFEYSMHRFFFHANITSYVGLTLHFLFHGCHHKWPMDGDRLVFPPVPASWFIGASYAAISAVLPPRYALPVFAGMGYGYVAYDCLHYAIHHSGGGGFMQRLPFVRDLRSRHLHHHYRDPTSGYGISSTLFDMLLGT